MKRVSPSQRMWQDKSKASQKKTKPHKKKEKYIKKGDPLQTGQNQTICTAKAAKVSQKNQPLKLTKLPLKNIRTIWSTIAD